MILITTSHSERINPKIVADMCLLCSREDEMYLFSRECDLKKLFQYFYLFKFHQYSHRQRVLTIIVYVNILTVCIIESSYIRTVAAIEPWIETSIVSKPSDVIKSMHISSMNFSAKLLDSIMKIHSSFL